jgi:RNA polymerase primary sigma factor
MRQRQDYGLSLTAIDQYLRQVKRIPPLTDEEEAHLLLCIARGVDMQRARDRLVAGYQHMVVKLARRFVRDCYHLELLDFVQEGSMGLLRAIGKYDVGKAVASFRTLAFAWVRGSMLTAYWRYERAIGIPLNKVRTIRQLNVMSTRLLALLGHEPTVAELAREMGMNKRDIQDLIVLQQQQVISLYKPLEDGETMLEDVLEESTASVFVDEELSSVGDVLDKLTVREQVVIRLRYGLVDGRAYTQKEVADRLGIASSRVAVLEHRAKMRLRKALERHLA